MTWISRSMTGLGLLFLSHACYSAREHAALQTTSAALSHLSDTPTSTLPLDISLETIFSLLLVTIGLVIGTPELRPIQWRVWAGKIEREGAEGFKDANGPGGVAKDFVGNPFKALENGSRMGFVDVRRQRREFAEWVREGGAADVAAGGKS